MPRQILFDLSEIDLDAVAYGPEEIRAVNPQRHEMEQLGGVIRMDLGAGRAIGFKDAREDEFWVRGHIPGRPVLPGALIVETVAQLCSFFYMKRFPDEDRFLGFGGMDAVRFRGTVVPGDRLIVLIESLELRRRRAIFRTQGLVGKRIVFEGSIIGVPI